MPEKFVDIWRRWSLRNWDKPDMLKMKLFSLHTFYSESNHCWIKNEFSCIAISKKNIKIHLTAFDVFLQSFYCRQMNNYRWKFTWAFEIFIQKKQENFKIKFSFDDSMRSLFLPKKINYHPLTKNEKCMKIWHKNMVNSFFFVCIIHFGCKFINIFIGNSCFFCARAKVHEVEKVSLINSIFLGFSPQKLTKFSVFLISGRFICST